MRYPRVFSLSILVFAITLMLSGCGSSQMGSSLTGGSSNFQSGTPPTVSAVAVQVNGVAPNRKQEVQFSEAMDPATINAQSFQVADSSGKAATGTVSYDPDFDTASFLPNPALQPGANYTATITTAAASVDGSHMANSYNFEFATRASTDTSPLSVSSVSPGPTSTCVSPGTQITVTFNEAPDASTVTAANFVVIGPSGSIPVNLSTNVTTTQVVLTPTSPLPSGPITVTVSNVADLAGVKITAPFKWGFSTVCGGGGGGGGTTQYQAMVFNESGKLSVHGQITMDTSGNMTITLTSAGLSTTLTVLFCPDFDASSGQTQPPCFDVTTFSTAADGTANATAKFPKPGNWAGGFLFATSSQLVYATYVTGYLSYATYMATLLPETETNGGVVTHYSPQAPLTSGTVTLSNGTLHFTVKGASPDTTYIATNSDTPHLYTSGTSVLSTFTTDSNGDGSTSAPFNNPLGPVGWAFQVDPQHNGDSGPAGYIGGFSVPQ